MDFLKPATRKLYRYFDRGTNGRSGVRAPGGVQQTHLPKNLPEPLLQSTPLRPGPIGTVWPLVAGSFT